MDTEFSLLGPLVVRIDGVPVPVRAAKQRGVLAALLLRANRVVPVEDLAEALWGDELPAEARTGVQNYVMRLRKALGPAGARITTQPGGYLIRVEPGELDLDRFEELLRQARTAAREGSWPAAAGQAAAALALWRGEPLADVGSDLLATREGPRLAELRLQALETRIDADLQQGRPGEVIGELRQLAADDPLREHLHALLMLALYRDGRQAEALAAYQHARDTLVEQLGAEPGPDLQQLHQQILTADPALTAPASPASASKAAAPVPRELPGDVAGFTGRAAELAQLDQFLLSPPGLARQANGTAAVISAVSGTAGVGKTALAVHWAHHAADRFPDGQLYVNLRGYDPDQPVPATDALAGFLRSLGVPGENIPPDETGRASRFRSILAEKRTLVVLDNASTVEQVRPLLPGHADCAVVVTSRDSLAGLVARDGAKRLDLDLLPLADAVALLRDLIGTRADAARSSAVMLAEQCVRLPLALRVAAELAATRPDIPLAILVSELADQQQRLDLLEVGGDPRTMVRAVFSWSFDHLGTDTARVFRLVSLHPGPDFAAHAVAALTHSTVDQARNEMDTLIRAHLIQPTTPNRYGMHDLLRAYAREQAAAEDPDGSGRQARTRLFDYYLSAAAAAMDILYPAEAHRRPLIPRSDAALPAMPEPADARAWLDSERANLVAVVVHCAEHGWPAHATSMAGTLFRYLMNGSHLAEAQVIYSNALQAARWSGDPAAEAEALKGLGSIAGSKGQSRDALAHFQAALERYQHCRDRAGQARVLHNLGFAEVQLHNLRSAAGYFRQAIAASEDAGDNLGAARTLTSLANIEADLGSHDQAARHLEHALLVLRDAGDQLGEAEALSRIGDLNLRRGQLAQAADSYGHALATYRHIQYPVGIADGLCNLGEVSLRQGEYQQAISYLQQALALYHKAGYQQGEIFTLRRLAAALLGNGQPTAARAELAAALRLAAETGDTYEQASVHCDLAESHNSAGEDGPARHHWQQALALYPELAAPEADEVRDRLAALGAGESIDEMRR
jgi:DNA-binding SARP family transcriptional activator/Tfp pilus assembly protein PilF